jgi:glucose-1-phosphate thymidylyltransferase
VKGVILAGGSGSRLRPLTLVTNKHLLPVYDKPMIWYPLDVLVRADIRRIFIVTGGEHFSAVGALLGAGDEEDLEPLGIQGSLTLAYGVQKHPRGIAHALGLAKEFVGPDAMVVVLGDNIFGDRDFLRSVDYRGGAHIFLKEIPDGLLYEHVDGVRHAKYGIAEVNGGHVVGIEEKPKAPKSNLAVTGAYIYESDVFDIIKGLKPSWRRELEVTDLNNTYIARGAMGYTVLKGEWTDAGTMESLQRASMLAARAR